MDHLVVAHEHATDEVRAVRLDQPERVRRVVAARPNPVGVVAVAVADVFLEHVAGRPTGDLVDDLPVGLRDQQRKPDRVPTVADDDRHRLVRADPHPDRGVIEHPIVEEDKRFAQAPIVAGSATHHGHGGAGDR